MLRQRGWRQHRATWLTAPRCYNTALHKYARYLLWRKLYIEAKQFGSSDVQMPRWQKPSPGHKHEHRHGRV